MPCPTGVGAVVSVGLTDVGKPTGAHGRTKLLAQVINSFSNSRPFILPHVICKSKILTHLTIIHWHISVMSVISVIHDIKVIKCLNDITDIKVIKRIRTLKEYVTEVIDVALSSAADPFLRSQCGPRCQRVVCVCVCGGGGVP